MICYRDMTFCTFYLDCRKADTCHRPLTPDVRRAAEEFGLPTAVFAEQPVCFEAEDGDDDE